MMMSDWPEEVRIIRPYTHTDTRPQTVSYQFHINNICLSILYVMSMSSLVKRDISDRGRTVDDVLHQYLTTVKPAFDEFIAPTKRFADIIIPRGGDNIVAIDLLVHHIKRELNKRGVHTTTTLPIELS